MTRSMIQLTISGYINGQNLNTLKKVYFIACHKIRSKWDVIFDRLKFCDTHSVVLPISYCAVII